MCTVGLVGYLNLLLARGLVVTPHSLDSLFLGNFQYCKRYAQNVFDFVFKLLYMF